MERDAINNEESGWVIERYVNSSICYWEGRSPDGFIPDNAKAIRFSREVDASIVLAWLCGGNGKVSEHMWIGGK